MLIALIGPDRYSVGVALKNCLAKYAPESEVLGDLNLTRLDGARVTPDELARAVQAIGFLAETRVVVVEGLMSRFGAGKAADTGEEGSGEKAEAAPTKGRGKADSGLADGFAKVFADIPESSVLILVERGGAAKNNSLLKAASK